MNIRRVIVCFSSAAALGLCTSVFPPVSWAQAGGGASGGGAGGGGTATGGSGMGAGGPSVGTGMSGGTGTGSQGVPGSAGGGTNANGNNLAGSGSGGAGLNPQDEQTHTKRREPREACRHRGLRSIPVISERAAVAQALALKITEEIGQQREDRPRISFGTKMHP